MLIAYTLYDAPVFFQWLIKIIGQMMYDIAGHGTVDDVVMALNMGAEWDNINNLTATLKSSIAPLGIMFLTIGLVCFFVEKASNGEATSTDFIFKGFIKFIIGFFLINNCHLIIDLIMDFGNGLSHLVTNVITEETQAADVNLKNQLYNAISDYYIRKCGVPQAYKFNNNLFVVVKQMFQYISVCWGWVHRFVGTLNWLLIPWLLSKALFIATLTTSITRLLEIGVRSVFAPIAIGASAFDGNQIAGKRYFKQFASLCIQGAVILAITGFVGVVSNAAGLSLDDLAKLTDAFNVTMAMPIVSSLLFRIAAVVLITKSRDISDSIVGV